jgi:hypothetical protein
VCHGEGKLGIKDTDTGIAVNCFKLCSRAEILAEIERLGLRGDEPSKPKQPEKAAQRRPAEETMERKRVAEAMDFWSQSRPWNTTRQIESYLRSRSIVIRMPSTIRWHGMTRHPEGGSRPVMVGLVEHVERGAIGASRTFIAIDGSSKATFRAPRMFVGLVAGGAVRLGSPQPGIELVVGEGIESTLSYMQLHDLPGWAALSANGIKTLVLPREARRVVIAADNDENGVGWKAALAAARRWTFDGRQVRIDMPPRPGTDWNDILLSGGLGHAA